MPRNSDGKGNSSDQNFSNWKTKYKNVNNVAKNIAKMTFGELAPGVKETASSASESLREANQFISKAKNQVGFQANSISKNSAGRKAMNIVKEAFDDLKSGSYGLDKMSDDSFDMEDDFDSDIRDYDSQMKSNAGDADAVAMYSNRKDTALLGKAIAHGNATTVSSLGKMTKTVASVTLKASQAQTQQLTNVMLMSMNSQNAALSATNGKLDSINTNLVNIINFNNNTAAEFYQKTAEYQSSMLEMVQSLGETMAKMQDVQENRARKEDEFDFSRGFNLGTYKNMIKKNIGDSSLGSSLGMLSSVSGMITGMGANPLTMVLPMVFGALTPGFIKRPVQRFDKKFTKGMENLLYRIGDLQYGTSIFSGLGEIFGKERPSVAKMNMANFRRDAMSWNGVAQKYLTEVIPSYLSKIEAGINRTSERYYNESKGIFQSKKNLRKEFTRGMESSYEAGMMPFTDEMKRILKQNNMKPEEMNAIMDNMNYFVNQAVYSSNTRRGSRNRDAARALKAQLHGKNINQNDISDLVSLMFERMNETTQSINNYMQNMDASYRHLFNDKESTEKNFARYRVGNINSKNRYSASGRRLEDLDDDDKAREEARQKRQEEIQKKFLDRFKRKSKKVYKVDKFSNWMYDVMSGTNFDIDEDYDLGEILAPVEEWREAQAKASGKSKKRKRKSRKAKPLATNVIEEYDNDSSPIQSVNSSSLSGSSGYGWNAKAQNALVNVIPQKLDKLEAAISKLASSYGGSSQPSLPSATGQKSNTKPIGKGNDHDMVSYDQAVNSKFDWIKNKANAVQRKLKGNSKGNEEGPTSEKESVLDRIANRINDTEESVKDYVRAANDNFMAPMVGGIFGKDGLIRRFFSKENIKILGDKLFNEKDGIFKNFGSWFRDQMDYVKYVFTGKGYTNRKGEKFEETKNSVFDHIANGYDWVYQKTMQHLFGEKFRENETFQKYFKTFDFKSKREEKRNKRLSESQGGDRESTIVDDESADAPKSKKKDPNTHTVATSGPEGSRVLVDLPNSKKKSNKKEKPLHERNGDYHTATTSGPEGSQVVVELPGAGKKKGSAKEEIQNAARETAEKIRNAGSKIVNDVIGDVKDSDVKKDHKEFAEKAKAQFKKFLPVGLAGAVVGGAAGLLGSIQGTGAVAPLFFSGGPIAGAVLGISATILARSEKFQKVLFGEKQEDGTRKGGLISQKTQNFFKKNAPLLVGGAALGAIKGIFKSAAGGAVVGGPGGFLLNTLLPGGIIGGAVMGLGVSLLKSSETFNNILFGNKKDKDGKKSTKSISETLSKAFSKSGHFIKGGLKGAAIGAGAGIALNSMGIIGGALSVGGPVGMGLIGLGLGIASQADKVKSMLFGTEEFDEKGNSKGRRKNGLFPRMRNYLVMNVFEPLKDNLKEKTQDFAFWLKKKITYPFRLAFGPIIDSFREIRKNISDTIKNVFENLAETIGKTIKTTLGIAFKPVTKAFKFVGRQITNVAFTGMKLALSPLSLGLNLVKFGSRNLRKKAMGQRTKTLWRHGADIVKGIAKATKEQWENDDREYVGGPFRGLDKLLTRGRDIFVNTKEGIDAAKASYNEGMRKQGFNSLGWMDVPEEKKKDKELQRLLRKDRKMWRGIDSERRAIAQENQHKELYLDSEELERYKNRLKKAGFKHTNFIQNSSDLNDLLYNKDDFLDRIKNNDKNKIKDSTQTLNFYESTKTYQKRIMDKFDYITKAFTKYAAQDAIARRKNVTLGNLKQIDEGLREAGLDWKDVGINPGDLVDATTLSGDDFDQYMYEQMNPENKSKTKFNDLIKDILQQQANQAEKNGESSEEILDRLNTLNQIEEANARMNASEQAVDTDSTEREIEDAAGFDFSSSSWFEPFKRHKKRKAKAERDAREASESEKARSGHRSYQDEEKKEDDDDGTIFTPGETKEKKKSLLSGLWAGFTGLLGGIGGLLGKGSFWKAAGISLIAAGTIGPWARDMFSKVFTFMEPAIDFVGARLKDAGYWLQANLPNIVEKMTNNICDNMSIVVDSVWKTASTLVSTVAKKAVNGIFHLVGQEGPFKDIDNLSVDNTKTFETEEEAQKYANLTGRNVDGNVVHGDENYIDEETGEEGRVSSGGAQRFKTARRAALQSYLNPKVASRIGGVAKGTVKAANFVSKINPLTRFATAPFRAVGQVATGVDRDKMNFLAKFLSSILTKLKALGTKMLIKHPKLGKMWNNICGGIIMAIHKVVKKPDIVEKIAEKITKKSGVGILKASPLGIVFAGIDLITGNLATAYLFGISEDKVTGAMRTISSALEIIFGSAAGVPLAVIFEVVKAFGGPDIKQVIAHAIYNRFGDKEYLQSALDEFELEVKKYNAENNTNITKEAYNESVNTKGIVSAFSKKKIDGSKYRATDEELAEYQRNKYKTVNNTSKDTENLTSDNTAYYTGMDGIDIAVEDPSNVGMGPGDISLRNKKVVPIGYGAVQSDPRWANMPLGRFPSGRMSTMATGGCGPTALSMVANTTPASVAQDAKSGGYIKDGGATAGLFTQGAKKYGLNAQNVSKTGLESTLRSGKPVILSGKSSESGPYTSAGHVVVANGIDSSGNVSVSDPMRGSRRIKVGELSKGMTHGWGYSKAAGYGSGGVVGYGITDNIKDIRINTGSGALLHKSSNVDSDFIQARRNITHSNSDKNKVKSIVQKFIERIQAFMIGMANLVKEWIPSETWSITVKTIIKKILNKLTESDPRKFERIADKILAKASDLIGFNLNDKFGIKFVKFNALADTIAGAGFAIYGAIDGALSAAYLFGIPQDSVTAGMRAVSAVVSLITSSSWADVLFLIIELLTGVNGRQWIAHMIYNFIGDEELLQNALDKMKNERNEYNQKYNKNLSESEYNELVNSETKLANRAKNFVSGIITKDHDSRVFGPGDVVGYGGTNFMSMSNAARQATTSTTLSKAKADTKIFKYKGIWYKSVKDFKGNDTWQEMNLMEIGDKNFVRTTKYEEISPPAGFDPDETLSKGFKAKNSLNIDGTTYDMKKYQDVMSSERPIGSEKLYKASWFSAERKDEKAKLDKTLKEIRESEKAKEKARSHTHTFQDFGKEYEEYKKSKGEELSPVDRAILKERYDYIAENSKDPRLQPGMAPNSLDEAVNKGTLNNESRIISKINYGYQLTDGEFNFNRIDFYRGLKVADIKAMAEYDSSLLRDDRIKKFRQVYNYYVRSGRYSLDRYLEDKELEGIFGRHDFVKALGGDGKTGDYEYKYGFPFFKTSDPRWADIDWRGATVKSRGSDLASLATIATAFGPNVLDPEYIYDKWIGKHEGWYDKSKGLKLDKVFSPSGYPAQKAGMVNGEKVIAKRLMNANSILSYLKANKPVIMTGYRYKSGPFGGYYNMSSAPTGGPDDYATIVARAANDAHMAVLNPFTTRSQNGIFDVHMLNDTVGKSGAAAVREAWGITGPSGGGITGKVDLSKKGNQTSDYADLKEAKGLDKIIALFQNFANIGLHMFDFLLGDEDYVSIFDKNVADDGGEDEEDNGKGKNAELTGYNGARKSGDLSSSGYLSANLNNIDQSSLPYGRSSSTIQNSVYELPKVVTNTLSNGSGKVKCYKFDGEYYMQISSSMYSRISEEKHDEMLADGKIMDVNEVPANLSSRTATVIGGYAPSSRTPGGMGGTWNYTGKSSRSGVISRSWSPRTAIKSSGLSIGPMSKNTLSIISTSPSSSSRYRDVSQIKSNTVGGNYANYGGGNRDIVFGPGDVVSVSSISSVGTLTTEEKKQVNAITAKAQNGEDLTQGEVDLLKKSGMSEGSIKSLTGGKTPIAGGITVDTSGSTSTSGTANLISTATSGVAGTDNLQALAGGVSAINIPEIQQYPGTTLTPRPGGIDYLVMHYTTSAASPAGSGRNICEDWNNTAQASADFVVDDGEIWQYNPDPKANYTWAVGLGPYENSNTSVSGSLFGTATNANTMSIEMQSSNTTGHYEEDACSPNWYFTDEVLNNSAGLAAKLMNDYNIPDDNLITHHHVNGKICPGPWAKDQAAFDSGFLPFKEKVLALKSGKTITTGATSGTSTTTSTSTETQTTAGGERDFDKLPSSVRMGAIVNASMAAAFGDDYEEAKQHFLEQAYDDYFGAPVTTTTTTTTEGQTIATNPTTSLAGGGLTSLLSGSGSGIVTSGGSTLVDPSDVKQSIWNYFIAKGLTPAGVAGLMGNLQHESYCSPYTTEGASTGEPDDPTNKSYIEAIDSGARSFTEHDSNGNALPGFGLAQWTYYTRKQGLLDMVKERGVSIADLQTQLDFLNSELEGGYSGVLGVLKSSNDVSETSDIVLRKFESPQYPDATAGIRLQDAQNYLNQYSGSVGNGPGDNMNNFALNTSVIGTAMLGAAFGDNYQDVKNQLLNGGNNANQQITTSNSIAGSTNISGATTLTGVPTSSSSSGAIDPNNVPQSVWNYFTSKGYTPQMTAGIMGNMSQESGLVPNQVQFGCNPFGSNEEYTSAADSGGYDFVNDGAGYGLVQFTFNGLKQRLLDAARANNTSVGDLKTQLDEIDAVIGMPEYCLDLANYIKDPNVSVSDATYLFEQKYEKAGVPAMENRLAAAQQFFDQFAGSTKASGYGPGMYDENILQKLGKKNSMSFRRRSRAVGYGPNWLQIVADVKALIAAQQPGYNQAGYIDITYNGQTISMRLDCSGFVGACLYFYGIPAMLNTTTWDYDPASSPLNGTDFVYMQWPGKENLLPGDILINTNSHVEIYAGNSTVYNGGAADAMNSATPTPYYQDYPGIWRPGNAGSVGDISTSSNATTGTTDSLSSTTGSTTTTTTTTIDSTGGVINSYVDPFSRMLSGVSNMVLTTSRGRAIAFGPGDNNAASFFTNTLGGSISSNYGKRSSDLGNEFHRGIDFAAAEGQDIYSPVSGEIVAEGNDVAGYGNYSVIRDRKGKNHLFAHMQNRSVYGVGDTVNQFDRIGSVGSTGRSTGSHLHYEIRNNGNKYSTIDPNTYKYDSEMGKSLNIHTTNRRAVEEVSDAPVGGGNKDMSNLSIQDKLKVAINTETIEGKMDAMIEALQMMVENTSKPVQPATSTITQNNTTVYGAGDIGKKNKKVIEKKEKTETRENDILASTHKMLAKRRRNNPRTGVI